MASAPGPFVHPGETAASASLAARDRRFGLLAVGFGIARLTSPIAASTKIPVGSPLASRTIFPPGGSGVSR